MKKPLLVITLVIPCGHTAAEAERITDRIWAAVPDIDDAAIAADLSMGDYARACDQAGHREAEDRQRHKTWGFEDLDA